MENQTKKQEPQYNFKIFPKMEEKFGVTDLQTSNN